MILSPFSGCCLRYTTPVDWRNRGIVPYDNRLLAAGHLRSPNITDALSSSTVGCGVLMRAPGEAAGDGAETSANPGWRKATALIVGYKTNMSSLDRLRGLAPDMGTYINEVCSFSSTLSHLGQNRPP